MLYSYIKSIRSKHWFVHPLLQFLDTAFLIIRLSLVPWLFLHPIFVHSLESCLQKDHENSNILSIRSFQSQFKLLWGNNSQYQWVFIILHDECCPPLHQPAGHLPHSKTLIQKSTYILKNDVKTFQPKSGPSNFHLDIFLIWCSLWSFVIDIFHPATHVPTLLQSSQSN